MADHSCEADPCITVEIPSVASAGGDHAVVAASSHSPLWGGSAAMGSAGGSILLSYLDDDLLLQVCGSLDVLEAVRLGSANHRTRRAFKASFPWTCMELAKWTSVPVFETRMAIEFQGAMAFLDDSDASFDRRVGVARLYGEAGQYDRGIMLLQECLVGTGDDEARMADVLQGLAEVSWRAQQARKGGGLEFVQKIVRCASRSCEFRRDMAERSTLHKRRLGETLEVLAENSACLGSTLIAEGSELEEGGIVEEAFAAADKAMDECIMLWERLGDRGKLADAVAASAAVDFYSGRSYDGAMLKLERAMALSLERGGGVSSRDSSRGNATTALCLFNMAYITQNVQGDTRAAIELYRRSLSIRQEVLGTRHPFTAATKDEMIVSSLRLQEETAPAGVPGDILDDFLDSLGLS